MKTQVHLVIQPNFSKKLEIRIDPVDRSDENETLVAEKVFSLIEKELNATKTEVLEGLDQTYVDFDCAGEKISLRADPWYFIALNIENDELRKKVFDRLSEEFEVVPYPIETED